MEQKSKTIFVIGQTEIKFLRDYAPELLMDYDDAVATCENIAFIRNEIQKKIKELQKERIELMQLDNIWEGLERQMVHFQGEALATLGDGI